MVNRSGEFSRIIVDPDGNATVVGTKVLDAAESPASPAVPSVTTDPDAIALGYDSVDGILDGVAGTELIQQITRLALGPVIDKLELIVRNLPPGSPDRLPVERLIEYLDLLSEAEAEESDVEKAFGKVEWNRLPGQVAAVLVNAEDPFLRALAVTSENVSLEQLSVLAGDEIIEVKVAAMLNPGYPIERTISVLREMSPGTEYKLIVKHLFLAPDRSVIFARKLLDQLGPDPFFSVLELYSEEGAEMMNPEVFALFFEYDEANGNQTIETPVGTIEFGGLDFPQFIILYHYGKSHGVDFGDGFYYEFEARLALATGTTFDPERALERKS